MGAIFHRSLRLNHGSLAQQKIRNNIETVRENKKRRVCQTN